MSAVERLRALLDKCGVEYEGGERSVRWRDRNGVMMQAFPLANGELGMGVWSCTPEQAIAATLGAGTCRDLGGTGANGEQVFNCSECGCVLSLYDSDGTNTLCTRFIYDYPRYCPECGRKVVDE